jgi:hypothetical protein
LSEIFYENSLNFAINPINNRIIHRKYQQNTPFHILIILRNAISWETAMLPFRKNALEILFGEKEFGC